MFESIFKYSNNGIIVTEVVDNGQNFIIKEINPEGEKMDKVRREDIVGKLITEVWPEIESFSLLTTMRRVYKTGIPDHHPTTEYKDARISGWRENYVFKTIRGEIVNIYYDRTDEKLAEKRLKENEEKNAAIIKALPDLFFKFADDGTYLDCWTSNVKLLISPKENFIGKRVDEVLSKELGREAIKLIKEVIETKEPKTLDYDLVIDGKRKYFEARMVYDTEKTVLAIVRDNSDKISMVEKIVESEEKFHKIFRTSPDAILITSVPEGIIVDANAAAETLMGYSMDEIKGKTTGELGFWLSSAERDIYIQKLLKEKQINNYETKFRVKTGILDTLLSGEMIEINGQKYFVSIIRNVTDFRKINRKLHLSEQKFKDIVENISEIVMEMDRDFIITFANKGVYDITGYLAEEIMGSNVRNFFTDESAKKCDEVHGKALREKDTSIHNVICEFICKSQEIKFLNIQWRIAWMNGDGPKTYMIARDVTKEETERRNKKVIEDKLKDEFRETLSRIGEDLKIMTTRGEKI